MRLFRWAEGRFYTRWFAPLRLTEPNAGKPLAASTDAALLQDLWHYDQWWLLAAEAFRAHPAASVLRATNCAHSLLGPAGGEAQHLSYSRDLGRVEQASFTSGDNVIVKAWTGALLPATYPPRPGHTAGRSRGTRRRWRLDPMWARPGK